jgi:hypothetical protein
MEDTGRAVKDPGVQDPVESGHNAEPGVGSLQQSHEAFPDDPIADSIAVQQRAERQLLDSAHGGPLAIERQLALVSSEQVRIDVAVACT